MSPCAGSVWATEMPDANTSRDSIAIELAPALNVGPTKRTGIAVLIFQVIAGMQPRYKG